MDTVSRYAGTTILTIAGWVLWCLFSRRNGFVPPVEVIALFIGALAIDILRKRQTRTIDRKGDVGPRSNTP
jgi:hypothetical protein